MHIFLTEDDILILEDAKKILTKDQKISIDSLAKELGWNRTKLTYAFKQHYKFTIEAYKIEMKIGKAKDLLESTLNPVSRIAMLSGYNNNSSFSVAFKRETGMAPLDWRRKKRGR